MSTPRVQRLKDKTMNLELYLYCSTYLCCEVPSQSVMYTSSIPVLRYVSRLTNDLLTFLLLLRNMNVGRLMHRSRDVPPQYSIEQDDWGKLGLYEWLWFLPA